MFGKVEEVFWRGGGGGGGVKWRKRSRSYLVILLGSFCSFYIGLHEHDGVDVFRKIHKSIGETVLLAIPINTSRTTCGIFHIEPVPVIVSISAISWAPAWFNIGILDVSDWLP